MVAETEGNTPRGQDGVSALKRRIGGFAGVLPAYASRMLGYAGRYGFRSLTSRIVILNAVGLMILTGGILYLNQFREGLTEARVHSLMTQGQIIAAAVAASATVDTDAITIDPDRLLELQAGEEIAPAEEEISNLDFPIHPERVSPLLRHILSDATVTARIYDPDGILIVNSANLYGHGDILRFDLAPPEKPSTPFLKKIWRKIYGWMFRGNLTRQKKFKIDNGLEFEEVRGALSGAPTGLVRANKKGEIIVNVAVPIKRLSAVFGVLVLSTKGGDIDGIVSAERWAIVRVFLVALFVAILMSILLAGTIAKPVHRLAVAAERVRKGVKKRVEIPDFTPRQDEIGHLSGALRDMTTSLYNRIDAIESFAADVSHELKNPLTSLLSAVETLSLVKDRKARDRLLEIMQDDVGRLDRLITDISDASRLDAELGREEAEAVDVVQLLETVTALDDEVRKDDEASTVLDIDKTPLMDGTAHPYVVHGHDIRLGQVVRNLIDNARSFSPPGAEVRVHATRIDGEIEISVEDDGPGVPPDNLRQIFRRFYTDRPGEESFGKNSGLGLSISKQIIDAHEGRIWAENMHAGTAGTAKNEVTGARFVVRLPAADPNQMPW